jgi:hypothetical protein
MPEAFEGLQRLMAWDFDRQVAEFQIRVAILNATPRSASP